MAKAINENRVNSGNAKAISQANPDPSLERGRCRDYRITGIERPTPFMGDDIVRASGKPEEVSRNDLPLLIAE